MPCSPPQTPRRRGKKKKRQIKGKKKKRNTISRKGKRHKGSKISAPKNCNQTLSLSSPGAPHRSPRPLPRSTSSAKRGPRQRAPLRRGSEAPPPAPLPIGGEGGAHFHTGRCVRCGAALLSRLIPARSLRCRPERFGSRLRSPRCAVVMRRGRSAVRYRWG